MRGQTTRQYVLSAAVLIAVTLARGQARAAAPQENNSSASSTVQGNPTAGKAILQGSGNCLSCHRVGVVGAILGPNLTNVGSRLSPDGMKQSLLAPPAQIEPQYRLYVVVAKSGKVVRGKLLNQDPFSLQLLDDAGELIAFSRSNIREGRFVDPAPMPSYQDKLTSAQIDDLIAYLSSLRAPENH